MRRRVYKVGGVGTGKVEGEGGGRGGRSSDQKVWLVKMKMKIESWTSLGGGRQNLDLSCIFFFAITRGRGAGVSIERGKRGMGEDGSLRHCLGRSPSSPDPGPPGDEMRGGEQNTHRFTYSLSLLKQGNQAPWFSDYIIIFLGRMFGRRRWIRVRAAGKSINIVLSVPKGKKKSIRWLIGPR
ncbi:hypothetical protein BGY98DRAFT_206527 [Russula aff. rugulosa BPL654]|nr:hypothetical protein BGY98DRAFT_206527 [Russula aff. rugulosa BPL654]